MTDESGDISMRTWIRNVGPINKVGFSDGVTDGQAATYQSSFDTGYEQGLNFGFCLGVIDTKTKFVQKKEHNLRDPREINCQICIKNSLEGPRM
ncbi:unnamed protein product [Parnassius apollo]|uniref:(apollo) hypothetical protein n=1 Tax=Parnassius apollo TaxID=110799 RepID=A0A8S3WD47_PARAO|nr:unnamed protein product [Parnassius apollo]